MESPSAEIHNLKGINPLSIEAEAASTLRQARALIGHRIRTVTLYATDRCHSRCKTCLIWAKEPNIDISLPMVGKVLDDPILLPDVSFALTGGEFIEHPQYDEILDLFSHAGVDYTLLSNAMDVQKLLEAVLKHEVPKVAISLDGDRESYLKVRGVDCYDGIVRIVDTLRSQGVDVVLNYTVNPWNNREALKHVIRFCHQHDAHLAVGFYSNMEFFDTTRRADTHYRVDDLFPSSYTRLYYEWADGKLKLPCYSIRSKAVVMPNGDINLCEQKMVPLGNLGTSTLSEIWGDERTQRTFEEYKNCNGCWLLCQRPMDIEMAVAMKTLAPNFILKILSRDCDWEKIDSLWSQIEKFSRAQAEKVVPA